MMKHSPLLITGLLMVCGTLGALRPVAARPASQTKPGEALLELPASGEASLDVSAFCLNFGEPFPKAVTVSTKLASDGVVRLLKAAARSGSGGSEVLQTQIGVWHQIEGEWGYKDKDVDMTKAKALVEAAAAEDSSPLVAKGLPLDQAIKDGAVSATVEGWQVVADAPKALPSDAPYYGKGILKLKNLGAKALTVRVPLGLVLEAANKAEQDMGIYAVMQHADAPTELPKTGQGGAARGAGNAGFLLLLAAATFLMHRARRRSAAAAGAR